MGGREAAISPARDILEQLDWVTAELEAQRPFLARIPAVQLPAQPLPDVPSLAGMYVSMLDRERQNVASMGAGSLPEVDADDVNAVLEAIIAARQDLLGRLSALEENAWQGPAPQGDEATLMGWAYQITLADGETLRAVAERIHESQLRLGGTPTHGA